jgi:tRNA (guanine37-N1)-methyltransferase
VRIDIVTIFPRMVAEALREGIVARARDRGIVDLRVHDLRDHTDDRHRTVDDVPYGGGPGMVLKADPVFRAVDAIAAEHTPAAVILLSPQGRRFTQAEARRLTGLDHLVLLCGRYEGIDERVREGLATEALSIGDYVLTGGELPALVVVDAVVRLLPGAVGDEASVEAESFEAGLLDYPHYTRPAVYRGREIPAVLTSGHHADIARWRRREALRRTFEGRPDLIDAVALDDEQRAWLRELIDEREKGATP